jgi:ApaG protein
LERNVFVSFSSEAVTRGIRVQVQARYLPERSQPEESQWLFVYQVRIANEGDHPARLIGRHWIVTDANGDVEVYKGEGVVGEQPLLAPGEFFEYTSGCPLKTSTGLMRGTYQMVTEDGDHFDVEIATFALHEPYTIH